MTWCWDWRWAWRGCLFDAIYGCDECLLVFFLRFVYLLHALMIGVRGIEHGQLGLIQAQLETKPIVDLRQ